jgi:hypothetical protein
MAIKFNCPHCQRALSVKDHLAGKRAACPSCKQVLVIPAPSAAAPAENLEEMAAAALGDQPEAAQAPQTIDFTCPQCDEPVSLPADLAGKRAPCPSCRNIIRIPMPEKKEAANWRQVDTSIPSGARRDTEAAPEGAWTSTRTLASGQALAEAGVIPKDRRKGPSRGQRLLRWGLVAAGFLAVAVGGVVAYVYRERNKQDRQVEAAVKAADAGAARDAAAAAEVNRAAGEYFLHTNRRKGAEAAQTHFNKARSFLAALPAGLGRDLLLVDLALSQVDLGGAGQDVNREQRLDWKATHNDVRQSLTPVDSPAARLYALRAVGRKLIEQGQGDFAVQLPGLYGGLGGAPQGGDGEAASDVPEAMGLVGLELLRAGQKDRAEKLLTQALARYPAAERPNAPPRPPLAPSVVALAVALDKPGPKPGKASDDEDMVLVGRAEGLAFKGDLKQAPTFPENTSAETRLRALVAVAGAGSGPPDAAVLQQAAGLLEGEGRVRSASPWLLYRLVELTARAGQDGPAQKLTEAIGDPALRGRAQVEVLRARLSSMPGKADEALADGVAKQPLVFSGMAREAVARHNARLDADAAKAVDGWDEALRPFGVLGAALGRQDKGR